MHFMDFLVYSSGEKMRILIFIPRNAAWAKSEQLFQLQRWSFFWQHNIMFLAQGKKKNKTPPQYNADILFCTAALLPG